jgi:hypothetical protein
LQRNRPENNLDNKRETNPQPVNQYRLFEIFIVSGPQAVPKRYFSGPARQRTLAS